MKHPFVFVAGDSPAEVLARLKKFCNEVCELFTVVQSDSEPYRFILRDMHDVELSVVIGEFIIVDQLGGMKNLSPAIFWQNYDVIGS